MDEITNVAAFVDGWLARELDDFDARSRDEIKSSLRALRSAIAPHLLETPLAKLLRDEIEKADANANHYATNTTAKAGEVCQYWRGRWSALREIQDRETSSASEGVE